MLLCNSSNPSICGVALSWKKRPHGSGVSFVDTLLKVFFSISSIEKTDLSEIFRKTGVIFNILFSIRFMLIY